MKIQIKNIIIVLGITVLSIYLFPQTVQTVVDLHKTWLTQIQQDSLAPLASQFASPRAGEFVLPPRVQAALSLLRAQELSAYRYSDRIRKDEETRQRLIESAYPIRYQENAPYLVHFADEPVAKTCRPIASAGGASLAYCP